MSTVEMNPLGLVQDGAVEPSGDGEVFRAISKEVKPQYILPLSALSLTFP